MSKVRFLLILLIGGFVGFALITAYRVSRDTGKSMGEALADVPGETVRALEDVRGRAVRAVHVGLDAAREKQDEIEERLNAPAESL